jgi:hypothetical protein
LDDIVEPLLIMIAQHQADAACALGKRGRIE